MFINISKLLLKIGSRDRMLITLLEIHIEFSTVPYRFRLVMVKVKRDHVISIFLINEKLDRTLGLTRLFSDH
jgi:hypothetical protein